MFVNTAQVTMEQLVFLVITLVVFGGVLLVGEAAFVGANVSFEDPFEKPQACESSAECRNEPCSSLAYCQNGRCDCPVVLGADIVVQVGDPDGESCDPLCAIGLTRCPAGSKRICRKGAAVEAGVGITNIYAGLDGYSCGCQQVLCNATNICPACLDANPGYFPTCENGNCGCSDCSEQCSSLNCTSRQTRVNCQNGNCRCENIVCPPGQRLVGCDDGACRCEEVVCRVWGECSDVNCGSGQKGTCNLERCVCIDKNACFQNNDCSGRGNCCALKRPTGVCYFRWQWWLQGCPSGDKGHVSRCDSCGILDRVLSEGCHCLA